MLTWISQQLTVMLDTNYKILINMFTQHCHLLPVMFANVCREPAPPGPGHPAHAAERQHHQHPHQRGPAGRLRQHDQTRQAHPHQEQDYQPPGQLATR